MLQHRPAPSSIRSSHPPTPSPSCHSPPPPLTPPPSTAVILFAMCFAAMLSVSAPVPTGPLPAFVDELDDSDDF